MASAEVQRRAVEDLVAAMASVSRQIANAQQRAAGCIVAGLDMSGAIAWLAEAEKSVSGAQDWLANPASRGGGRG